MASFFSQLISGNKLVDLSMYPSAPTWRNGRSGAADISKRLDMFLLSESLLLSFSFYRTWATPSDVSDHYPICLEWALKAALFVGLSNLIELSCWRRTLLIWSIPPRRILWT